MISRAKKYVAVLLAFVCVCMIFSPLTAYAAEDSSQHETVKVGFFAMDGYHVMDEEGNRSGYGYDFLRLMARYWDVDYEYVGYDKSWDDMQQMLEDDSEAIMAFIGPKIEQDWDATNQQDKPMVSRRILVSLYRC